MKVAIIYGGIPMSLLEVIEFLGLDYYKFLKLVIMSCNKNLNMRNLVKVYLDNHDTFYNNKALTDVLCKVTEALACNIKPVIMNAPVVRCEIIELNDSKMVVVYEIGATSLLGLSASST